MRTSLNKTAEIEAWLQGAKDPEEMLLFEAQLLLTPGLSETVYWQRRVQELVAAYSRKKLKAEIQDVDNQLFTSHRHRSFRQRIVDLFG